jgi:hypothetical protein
VSWKPENIEVIRRIYEDHEGSARGLLVCGALAGALSISALGGRLLEGVDLSGDPRLRARQEYGPVIGAAIGAGITVGIGLLLVPLVTWVFVFPRRGYPQKG